MRFLLNRFQTGTKLNKHSMIVIIASVVIASTFAYSGWNIYAVEQLQFSIADKEKFNYFDMVNGAKVSVCNPLPFFVHFNEFNIVMILQGDEKGTFTVQGITLPPSSSLELEGKFRSETFEESQYIAMNFDGMFGGGVPVRIDPSNLAIATEIETPIIGVIPYSVTNQYSGFDFYNKMNDIDFKC